VSRPRLHSVETLDGRLVNGWVGFPGGYDNWQAMHDHLQKLRGRKQHRLPVRSRVEGNRFRAIPPRAR
jgi:hypothetical protein